jgi:hypothetical protein
VTVYIEDEAWASCTFDLAGSPQQLVKESDRRVVGYAGQYRLLTIDDRATKDKFSCKLIAKQVGGLLALVGGMAVGAAVVLSGPVGWVAFAAVTVVVVGTAVAVYTHDCSDPLKNGGWALFHTTVHIQGRNAVLYNRSQLACSNGGILVASETQAAAQALSDAMVWNARLEVGVQILSNALIGYIIGRGVADPGSDFDKLTIPLALGSYATTDLLFAKDLGPWQSLGVGLVFSTVGYIAGALGQRVPSLAFLKGWGTEIGWQDLKTTLPAAVVGICADLLENHLASVNTDIVNNAANRSSAASGKTIISLDE